MHSIWLGAGGEQRAWPTHRDHTHSAPPRHPRHADRRPARGPDWPLAGAGGPAPPPHPGPVRL